MNTELRGTSEQPQAWRVTDGDNIIHILFENARFGDAHLGPQARADQESGPQAAGGGEDSRRLKFRWLLKKSGLETRIRGVPNVRFSRSRAGHAQSQNTCPQSRSAILETRPRAAGFPTSSLFETFEQRLIENSDSGFRTRLNSRGPRGVPQHPLSELDAAPRERERERGRAAGTHICFEKKQWNLVFPFSLGEKVDAAFARATKGWGLPPTTVPICILLSTRNYGTFQARFGDDRSFQRTRDGLRGSPEHSPSSSPRHQSQPLSKTNGILD